MSQRDVYIAKMKAQLDELSLKMDELELKSQAAKTLARDTYRAEMAKLRQQSKEAMAQLETLKAAGEDKWDSLKTDMEKLRDAVTSSFNYFKSKF